MISKIYNLFVKSSLMVLLVFSLWLVITAALKKDVGNLSDWISAFCNIVMAYAAYRAFVFAKDYFSDFIKKDGYELIKNLQLELIPKYRDNLNFSSLNVLDIEVPSYINGGIGVFQDEDEISYLPQTLPVDLKSLETRFKEGRRLEKEIRETLQSLEIYGWEMVPKKKQELFDAFLIGKVLFNTVHNITIYLSEILEREAPDFSPRFDNDFIQRHDPVKPTSPPRYQDVDVLVEKIIFFQKQLCDPEIDTPYVRTIRGIEKYFQDGRHLKNYFRYTRD